MIITGEVKEIQNIIIKIKEKFKISNCGPAEFILGIKIEKQKNKIYYITK